jgi:hypothetical protein
MVLMKALMDVMEVVNVGYAEMLDDSFQLT